MNETKHNIKISGAIIEQLSSLNEEEPTKYWRSGMRLVVRTRWVPIFKAFATERAAWIDRERDLQKDGRYVSCAPPYQCTKEELEAAAREELCHTIEVCDETGTVVDWWSVPTE